MPRPPRLATVGLAYHVLNRPAERNTLFKKDASWMYHNPDKQITVNVEFVGGDKVAYSRWVDPEHGPHEIGTAAIEATELIERESRKTDINH